MRAAELSSGPHALFSTGARGIALPPGVAGGSYLGLAVPATAGEGDGTRTDADAAECRDAEQEQVGAGGGQAAARRRAGAHRRGGAAGAGRRAGCRRSSPCSRAGVPPQFAVQPGGVPPQLCWHGWQLLPRHVWHCGPWHSWQELRTVALVALRALAAGLVAVVADAGGRAALAVGVGEAARRDGVTADVHRHADRRGDRVTRDDRDVEVPGRVAVVAAVADVGNGRVRPALATRVRETANRTRRRRTG